MYWYCSYCIRTKLKLFLLLNFLQVTSNHLDVCWSTSQSFTPLSDFSYHTRQYPHYVYFFIVNRISFCTYGIGINRRLQNEPSNPSILGQILSFEIFTQSEIDRGPRRFIHVKSAPTTDPIGWKGTTPTSQKCIAAGSAERLSRPKSPKYGRHKPKSHFPWFLGD